MKKINKKILGSSFKQYRYLSANTFEEGKTNLITENNIQELIDSFYNRQVEVFFYKGHKADQSLEREPLGKILNVYKADDSIGLMAEIELNDGGEKIINEKGFYPSIEMVGKKIEEDENNIYWQNCELKAVSAVEYPASKSVELLCASGIIEDKNIVQDEGGKDMNEKLKELLAKIKTGDADAKKEFFELISKDEELGNALLETLMDKAEPVKEEPVKEELLDKKIEVNDDGSTKEVETKKEEEVKKEEPKKEEEDKKDEEPKSEASLSAIEFNSWADEYAENKGGIRCSSKSESEAYVKAKKLFKGGFKKEEIMGMVSNILQPLGASKVEEVNLSAVDKDKAMENISQMFK
ncbi:VSH-1 capsid protein [Brachyspira pilosicoli WesB]|uniref:VSH-1 capsid protein n=1 Tax=Brachyspira pilosicoli WesB TaxID=1161918 RepID=K0JIG3_BRAPL|nr:phage capsid protein [Brachyspira pilosicoli]CCG58013.1 VSH-1 capsid protein [Brachyspira pilosicoli WesB]